MRYLALPVLFCNIIGTVLLLLSPSNTADLFRTLVPSVSKETPKYEKNAIEPRKNIITNIVIINFIGILAKSIYNKIRIKLDFFPII